MSTITFIMYLSERESPSVEKPAQSVAINKKVPTAIYLLGMTSLLTDISSEMVASILPVYLFTVLNLSPMQFGIVDGVFNGSTALVRLLSAYVADYQNKHKIVAFLGYFLSAISRLAMLFDGGTRTSAITGPSARRTRWVPSPAVTTVPS